MMRGDTAQRAVGANGGPVQNGGGRMADELDLEKGDPSRAEQRRQRRREATSTPTGESKATTDKLDKELHSRLVDAFDQVVEWREARDDEELATAISEDKEKMAKGLVSLTHAVVPLRQPLLIFLGFVEPVLAFGRVTRILATRWVARRQQQAEDLATAQAEWDAMHNQPNSYAQPGPVAQ
jgi:hypothetical protein